MTLLVRDEEDILETHLDYHLAQGVDFFLIMDHHSTDGTADILAGYERAGVAKILSQPDPGYHQGEWVTGMAQQAAIHYEADWVINSDADEFWWPVEGDLRSTLQTIPPSFGVLSVSRHDFRPSVHESGRFLDRMTFRDVVSTNSLGQPLPPKVCHRAHSEVVVAQGNHSVVGGELGAVLEVDEVVILHYPLRTYEQFERKIANGGRAYELSHELPPGMGGTWRSLYELYQQGGLLEFYQRDVLSPDRIRRELREGSVVEDVRLQAFMRGLDAR